MTQRRGLTVPSDAVLDEFEKQSLVQQGQVVYTARLKLITPALFGGFDVRKPDAFTPIRSKAIRGHLREWWRMLALAGDLDDLNLPGMPLKGDAAKVRAKEFSMWGALGNAAPLPPSQIGISAEVVAGQLPTLEPYEILQAVWNNERQAHVQRYVPQVPFNALTYALIFASAQAGKDGNNAVVPRELCREGLQFNVEISAPDDPWTATLLRTLHYWATFGGVGSRTSRGIGAVTLLSVSCDGKAMNVPPWPAGCLDELGRFTIGALKGVVVFRGTEAPRFGTALEALAWGIDQLAGFLQRDNGIARSWNQGMSHWPEARLVRSRTNTWFRLRVGHDPHDKNPAHAPPRLPGGTPIGPYAPRLAFGHRTYRFAPKHTTRRKEKFEHPDPSPHSLAPVDSDRLPSSLILRPVVWTNADGSQRFGCALVQRSAMAGHALPMASLKREGGQITVGASDLNAWNPKWRAGVTGGCANITPLEQPGCACGVFDAPADAAQAFVNFVFNTVHPGWKAP